jgi:hypothetical protein
VSYTNNNNNNHNSNKKKQVLVSKYKDNVIKLEPSKKRAKQKNDLLRQVTNC